MTAKRKLPYREGDGFVLPLRDGRKAIGVVARMNGEGIVIGYFFGPAYGDVPSSAVLSHLTAEEAVLVGQCGHLGLIRRQWTVLGPVERWNRDDWPLPAFVRRDLMTGRPRKIRYEETDLNTEVESVSCTEEDVRNLPEDGLMGHGLVEIRLTKLLGET